MLFLKYISAEKHQDLFYNNIYLYFILGKVLNEGSLLKGIYVLPFWKSFIQVFQRMGDSNLISAALYQLKPTEEFVPCLNLIWPY